MLQFWSVRIFDRDQDDLPCTFGRILLHVDVEIQEVIEVECESSFSHGLRRFAFTLISGFVVILPIQLCKVVVYSRLIEERSMTFLTLKGFDVRLIVVGRDFTFEIQLASQFRFIDHCFERIRHLWNVGLQTLLSVVVCLRLIIVIGNYHSLLSARLNHLRHSLSLDRRWLTQLLYFFDHGRKNLVHVPLFGCHLLIVFENGIVESLLLLKSSSNGLISLVFVRLNVPLGLAEIIGVEVLSTEPAVEEPLICVEVHALRFNSTKLDLSGNTPTSFHSINQL